MSHPELLQRFRECRRYREARSWQKPLISPRRFLRNQWRKHGFFSVPAGSLRCTRTFHLPAFTVVVGESVSQQLESYGIYEDALTEAFLHLIEPGQVAVDIGMHLGYYTTLFAALVGPAGEVHAFEPTPSTREIARRNLQLFSNVTVHPEALWSSPQSLRFHDYGIQWMAFNSFTHAKMTGAPEPKTFTVTAMTLDEFRAGLGKPIHILKIDAESAEREILLGARQVLASDRPLISLEVGDSEGAPSSRSVVEQLQSHGYVAWEFAGGTFRRHALRTGYGYDNLIFAGGQRDLTI